jgi:hypothetical protein
VDVFHNWYLEDGGKLMEFNEEHHAFYKGMLELKEWGEKFMYTFLFIDPVLHL